ncbi:iron chaperone [Paenibacillus xylaniclasticus]|uniref:iron chaperone n=1 Tax=Paenibacillus xylaniclasticus TaxID=588083 RepID=UPI000FD72874|nr:MULTISPECIES: iron chaperone [Paenibacillus]GFN33027.1 intracellular iron chaperone frataxin [Paenibacillus curdlanolyticus]
MNIFSEFIEQIDNPRHRARTEEVLKWVAKQYPALVPKVAWNQPMYTDHGTFIIGFSVAKPHLAVAPERAGIVRFSDEIVQAGYEHTKQLVRIPWTSPVYFSLLERMIEYNIADKADCTTFWRK